MLSSEFGKKLDGPLSDFTCIYDKGLLNFNKNWIVTLANKLGEAQFERELPELKSYLQAFKSERGQIERVFGLVINRFNILQKPFKGRGLRYNRLSQIVLLSLQLTNLVFKFNQSLDPQNTTNMVQKNPPADFNDLLRRMTE